MGATREVYIKVGEGYERREVTLGLYNDKMVEIRTGLKEGEEIVVNPKVLLDEGDKTKTREAGQEKNGDKEKEKLYTPGGGDPAKGGGFPGGGGMPGGGKAGGFPGGGMPGGGDPAKGGGFPGGGDPTKGGGKKGWKGKGGGGFPGGGPQAPIGE
jgi:hypothetical protein